MKIGISLNEVFRDHLSQLKYTYEKYFMPDGVELDISGIDTFDLEKYFYFSDKEKLNRFMYVDAPLEIFGHADQVDSGLMNSFNGFFMDVEDDEEHTITLVSREIGKSIPATLFFLSKLGCTANDYKFVKANEDEWLDFDILITANPIALENKPEGRISVKVTAPYNKETKADFTIDSLMDFINDEELRNKIMNSKKNKLNE